jgi:hypothetical protein
LLANKTPEEYQIEACDYWRGCTTILNSEVAALKKCEEIFNNTKNRWLDKDFGPKTERAEDDEEGSKQALYF